MLYNTDNKDFKYLLFNINLKLEDLREDSLSAFIQYETKYFALCLKNNGIVETIGFGEDNLEEL
jgi:hypothetical protein